MVKISAEKHFQAGISRLPQVPVDCPLRQNLTEAFCGRNLLLPVDWYRHQSTGIDKMSLQKHSVLKNTVTSRLVSAPVDWHSISAKISLFRSTSEMHQKFPRPPKIPKFCGEVYCTLVYLGKIHYKMYLLPIPRLTQNPKLTKWFN